MGCFSWFTIEGSKILNNFCGCDSNSICFDHHQIIYLFDHQGNVWKEKKYEGYGVFGEKDYYQLLAEMNGLESRDQGIQIEFDQKPDQSFIFPVLSIDDDWYKNYGKDHDFSQKMKNDPNQGNHKWHLDDVWDY